MRISELQEITMKVGNLDTQLSNIAVQNKEHWKTGKHIGDIEDKKVLLFKATDKNWIYSLWKENELISYLLLVNNSPVEVSQVWIDPNYRGQKIFSKLLWYLKTRENYSSILLGDIHSKDTVEVLKYLSRFKNYWTNGKEKISYDSTEIDKFYSLERPTEWKLVLENNGDFSSWPKYTTGYMVNDYYDWQIE